MAQANLPSLEPRQYLNPIDIYAAKNQSDTTLASLSDLSKRVQELSDRILILESQNRFLISELRNIKEGALKQHPPGYLPSSLPYYPPHLPVGGSPFAAANPAFHRAELLQPNFSHGPLGLSYTPPTPPFMSYPPPSESVNPFYRAPAAPFYRAPVENSLPFSAPLAPPVQESFLPRPPAYKEAVSLPLSYIDPKKKEIPPSEMHAKVNPSSSPAAEQQLNCFSPLRLQEPTRSSLQEATQERTHKERSSLRRLQRSKSEEEDPNYRPYSKIKR